MSTPTASWGSSVSQHLHASKRILRDAPFYTNIATLDVAELEALEPDAFEALRLIRSCINTITPVNQIPPEILALVPDFWDTCDRRRGIITLTHVCQAWRDIFTSLPSLWTDLYCVDVDKTRVYLERSKASPIDVSLTCLRKPFFQVVPCAIGRLKSLSVEATPGTLQDITVHLSRPAPLLEKLSIRGNHRPFQQRNPTLTSALFNGDLSSLHELHLEFVRTGLPWRNMVNLTSFRLANTSPGEVTVKQLLDFFEGAPRLRKVDIYHVSLAPGAPNGRLVSLACLKEMEIIGRKLPSPLLDHLLIPAEAELTIEVDFINPLTQDDLPRSLSNLGNFSNFTTIDLCGDRSYPYIQFSGPNVHVKMMTRIYGADDACSLFESLAQFDTSRAERLTIDCGKFLSSDPGPYQALLPMKDLRTLTLYLCESLPAFISALHPKIGSSEVVICPKLEELVIEHRDPHMITNVIGMAAARASGGAKLKSVEMVNRLDLVYPQIDVMELKKHVLHVECYGIRDDSDGSDEDEED